MTWVAVAIGGAAVIGAGASYAGASKQAKASQQAGQLNMDMFNTLNRQQQPFIGSGYGAMGRLNTLLGINPNPNYRPSARAGLNGYMPTPGGGVQPIMQGGSDAYLNQITGQGPRMYAGGPAGDPYMNRNMRLNQILSLRAAHGDNQAADMMRSIAGLG